MALQPTVLTGLLTLKHQKNPPFLPSVQQQVPIRGTNSRKKKGCCTEHYSKPDLPSVLLPSHSVCILFLFQNSKFCLLMECGHAGNIMHLLFSLKPDQNYSAISEKPGHCAFCFSRDELIQTGSLHRKAPSCQHSPFTHWFIPTPIFCFLH